jgi:hypothetical protein
MLAVPMFARFAYETERDMPLKGIPWERPPDVRPGDQGGPLPGQKPPPPPGAHEGSGSTTPVRPPNAAKDG